MGELVNHCPDTIFLVNHCANADPRAFFDPAEDLTEKPSHNRDEWIRDVKNIASNKNVACKISGLVTRVPGHTLTANNLAPAVNQCLDIFGSDRVMFASDWPVCLRKMTLGNWLGILQEIVSTRSIADQRKLFHDNAAKYYKI